MAKTKYFQVNCYACGKVIFGLHNRSGGVFYKTSIDGEYHKKTCSSGHFRDAIQSNSVPIKHSKVEDDHYDQLLFPEQRICRLCWNTNGWIRPSGQLGKTSNESFEAEWGYGHEEWLFDLDKVIDGYHYGFLEPVNKFHDKYIGGLFDFTFYTIDAESKNKYWVGNLNNVEVINEVKAAEINEVYIKRGWLDLMKRDLRDLKLDEKSLDKWVRENKLFNVRYKPIEMSNIFPRIKFMENVELITSSRYNLLPVTNKQRDIIDSGKNDFDFNSGSKNADNLAENAIRGYSQREVELPLKHNKMVKSFFNYLKKIHGNDVSRECKAAKNGRVDIVVKEKNKYVFYEIKTYNHLETSIRIAIGQLLEYACFPDKQNAHKLYIVSDVEPSSDINKYILHLKTILRISIGYIHFDPDKGKIVNQIN